MKMTRRHWLQTTSLAALASMLPASLRAALIDVVERPLVRDFEKPMFDIPGQIASPVIVESIELLRVRNQYFVRTRSTDGAEGLIGTKQINDFIPIFTNVVAPCFVGKDARLIESLVDEAYLANYKYAGIPLWAPTAYVEQSLLDMLGKIAGKRVADMCGGASREKIPVYLSGSARELSAEEEVDVYVKSAALTNTNAVKFKIGGRMSRNLDTYPGRTETLLRLARRELGDKAILMADANGSYDVRHAIQVGQLMEELNYTFFEEPCPWQNYGETQAVAKALSIPIAAGEQDSSLWQFRWMLENNVMRIAQPDLNYNGGFIRAKRVARMAEAMGRSIQPHNTQTGATSVNILQFAACTPNATPFMEYPCRKLRPVEDWYSPYFKIENGFIEVPKGPGMGIEFDPVYIAGAETIARIDAPKDKALWN